MALAISALRRYNAEFGTIPRDRRLKSLHLVLDRPQLAEYVIPDLTRWEDWSALRAVI